MKKPEISLEVLTLGRFEMTIAGKSVATEWPDETTKVLFCSLLSPLDLYLTWDRLCRSTWEIPLKKTGREQLEDFYLRPLNSFLVKEFGFTPLITGDEGIRIDHTLIHLDAFDFNSAVLDGLKQLSLGNQQASFDSFSKAKTIYSGSYLPGISGKIIANTRKELDSIFRITGTVENKTGKAIHQQEKSSHY
jgi:hypothetical protein